MSFRDLLTQQLEIDKKIRRGEKWDDEDPKVGGTNPDDDDPAAEAEAKEKAEAKAAKGKAK